MAPRRKKTAFQIEEEKRKEERRQALLRGERDPAFKPRFRPEDRATNLTATDPAREELRQKQLREDPVFAEKVRIIEERQQAEVVAQAQEEVKTPEQKEIEAEQTRLLEEETPERRELDPDRGLLEKVPIIGGSVAAGRTIIGEPLKDLLGIRKFKGDSISPEELRTAQLTAIEKQEIEKGLTANEKFGAFVEGIPVLGSLASKYVGGLIETPSGNAAEVVRNIRKERRRISNIETNVKLGYLPVESAQTQVNDIEQNIQRLESRVKLLINNSPELKFNSDNVNTIETEILIAREKVFQAKLNILTGATRDATELELFLKSQGEADIEEPFEF